MKAPRSGNSVKFKDHPIRLVNLAVRELFIRSNVPPDPTVAAELDTCSLTLSTSEYDTKEKHIMATLKLEVGSEIGESEVPYLMRIEVAGFFKVDESWLPAEEVVGWTKRSAPFSLYPYLREHAFGLSSRCGFKPLLLPLVEVPVINIRKPTQTRKGHALGKLKS